MAQKRSFGQITRLPSKRWRARYTGPDGRLHNGPSTFDTRVDAEAWLTDERRAISAGNWAPPQLRHAMTAPTTVGEYADSWLARRDLKPRTQSHYRALLDRLILPTFADAVLDAVTPRQVADWHHMLGTGQPTLRAHAYGLLKAIYTTAVAENECATNPCRVRGASTTKRARQVRPATLDELAAVVRAMPEQYRLLTLLAAWCALRFGELTELRRKDVDLANDVLHVRRGVARADGEVIVGMPKSDAGRRDVAIPPHLVPMLREHLGSSIAGGRERLLFPAVGDPTKHLAPATLYRPFYVARDAAGRPDLRWHDLRHTGAVLAASTGATLAELMARLGHSTPQAALRYQHAAAGRDRQIAAALSALANSQE
ncbi:site-specific integrase [Rhodococcus aerolatus]